MFVLDTDTLSLLHSGNPKIVANGARVDPVDIATTIVTKVEILRGRFDFLFKASHGEQLLRAQWWLRRSEELLRQIVVLPFDARAAALFDGLCGSRTPKPMGRADLLIACIVMAHQATLVTRNLKHFRDVPTLRVVNWAD